MDRSGSHRSSVALLLACALASCTHHAGVLKRYDDKKPVAGTEQFVPGAATTWTFTFDPKAQGGLVRGSVAAATEATLEFDIESHVVDAKNDYDVAEAIVLRAILAPFYLVFLGPVFGADVRDYGGDGSVGVGDRLLNAVHVINPLMAWPLGTPTAGEDHVVEVRRERLPAKVCPPLALELAILGRGTTATLPVVVAADGKFEVDAMPVVAQVWDQGVRAELRDRNTGRVEPVPGFGPRLGQYLASTGLLVELEWGVARAADTRSAYEKFRVAHANSRYEAEIGERLAEIDWRDAIRGDRTSLLVFAATRPTHPRAAEAKARVEELDWQEAVGADTIRAYEMFLAAQPDGLRAEMARRRLADLGAVRDRERALRVDTPEAYRRYLADHPDASDADAVRARIALLDEQAPVWQATCATGTADAFRGFVAKNPASPWVNAAQRALQDLEGRDIVDLIEEGKIEVGASGGGIQSAGLDVKRLAPYPLVVRVPAGTYLVASRSSAQNMVVTRDTTMKLTDVASFVRLDVACANKPKDIPHSGDSFALERPAHNGQLARLAAVLDRAKVDYATRQAAVWIVTDDATYGGLGILVSRPMGAISGGSRVIGPEAAARALQLCADAGIEIRGTQLLADRESFAPQLPDGELKTWLAAQQPSPQKQ
ncbi:MAG: hypothetical protein JNK78_06045 [Planctomycetes bacterium]|nr:hypothetical protein [Planctomycetota bacterium]